MIKAFKIWDRSMQLPYAIVAKFGPDVVNKLS